jgi:selenocysteine-specific elongation factor
MPEQLDQLTRAVHKRVIDAGANGLDVAALDDRERAVLARIDDVLVDSGRVRRADARDPLADHPFAAALLAAKFTPPDAVGVDRGELRQLIQRGTVVERDGVHFHAETIDAAARVAATLLAQNPDGFTVAQFRDATGSSRKHALPLVAELDSRGVTRRRDDLRIGGPRLPAL